MARYRRMRTYARPRRRVRRYFTRARRRISKAKIPLEVAVAGVSTLFTPGADYMGTTPLQNIQSQNWQELGNNLKAGFLGIDYNNKVDLWKALNPFDFSTTRYSKMLIYAGVLSKVRHRLVKIPMNKIPFVGRYIS